MNMYKITDKKELLEILYEYDTYTLTKESEPIITLAHQNLKAKKITDIYEYDKALNKEIVFLCFKDYDYFVINDFRIYGYIKDESIHLFTKLE